MRLITFFILLFNGLASVLVHQDVELSHVLPEAAKRANIDKRFLDSKQCKWISDHLNAKCVSGFSHLVSGLDVQGLFLSGSFEFDMRKETQTWRDLYHNFVRPMLQTRHSKLHAMIAHPRFQKNIYTQHTIFIEEMLKNINFDINDHEFKVTSRWNHNNQFIVPLDVELIYRKKSSHSHEGGSEFEIEFLFKFEDSTLFKLMFEVAYYKRAIRHLTFYSVEPPDFTLAELWVGLTLASIAEKGYRFAPRLIVTRSLVVNMMALNFMENSPEEDNALTWFTPNGINTFNVLHVLSVTLGGQIGAEIVETPWIIDEVDLIVKISMANVLSASFLTPK